MLEKGTFNEDDVASIWNRSIRSVLECFSPLLQYPMSSWHFLLIVMTTDSMVFHWIWTGIHVDNQLWVIRDPLFYLRPVLSLLWLHLSLWLSLLPAHDHLCYQSLMAVLALGRMVSFINIGHSSYMSFIRTTHQNRHSHYVTFNTIRSVNIITMKQDLWMICDCSINNQQENDLFVIHLPKKYNL